MEINIEADTRGRRSHSGRISLPATSVPQPPRVKVGKAGKDHSRIVSLKVCLYAIDLCQGWLIVGRGCEGSVSWVPCSCGVWGWNGWLWVSELGMMYFYRVFGARLNGFVS